MEFSEEQKAYLEKIGKVAEFTKTIAPQLNDILSEGKKFLTPEQLKEVEAKFPDGNTFKSVEDKLNNLQEILKQARA